MIHEILTTKRLVLSPIDVRDATDIFHHFNANITKFMYPKPASVIEDTLDFIQYSNKLREEGKEIVWVARLKDTKEFVGCMGLHQMNTKTPELGIWIQEGMFGQHLGLEGMNEIITYARSHCTHDYLIYPVDKRNFASRNIPETHGGIIKKAYQKIGASGNHLDIIEYWIYPETPLNYRFPTILFQGDSITDCNRKRHIFYDLGEGYVSQIMPELKNAVILNRGVSGDRTNELLIRWQEDVIFHQPDILSLLCGINDVWHYFKWNKPTSPKIFEDNYRQLIEWVKRDSPQTHMVLIEPFGYPIGELEASWEPMIEALRHIVKRLANEYHLSHIPMNQYMQKWKDIYPMEMILPDGVHPSPLGHKLMANVIKKTMRQLLMEYQLHQCHE
jgi:lysophospholipase L1-like esterase